LQTYPSITFEPIWEIGGEIAYSLQLLFAIMQKLLLVVLFALSMLFVGCDDFGCKNESPAEHVSPDGQWKYVSFDRNCGATTRSNLQVSILPASRSLPSGAANAFIADDNHGATRFVAQPEWVNAHKLRIEYSPKARIFKRESKVGPINVEYVMQP
jgi:hypothetical protein